MSTEMLSTGMPEVFEDESSLFARKIAFACTNVQAVAIMVTLIPVLISIGI
jgi:hypothetical protein